MRTRGKIVSGVLVMAVVGIVATSVYVGMIWNPTYPGQLVKRVHSIAAKHGGYTRYASIPLFLQEAVIATEDKSFYQNQGVDVEGILRALWVDLLHRQFVQGGSTITEQLVKDVFLTDQKTISRKMKQIVLSLILSRYFSKHEILTMYLNEVYLGHGAYGVGDAAYTYFHETPAQLTPAQCALLAGLPQAPSLYDPLTHYNLSKRRQEEVLASMVGSGYITSQRAQVLASTPLDLVSAKAMS